jgi:hypothetical protein
MKVFVLAALVCVGCACKGSSSGGGTGPGTGSGSGSGKPVVGDPATCDAIEAHVEDLYRAAAERTKMTDGEVADNVAMVLRDCKAAPDRVVACVKKATAVAQLESQCLAPLDDQGSEGEQFK